MMMPDLREAHFGDGLGGIAGTSSKDSEVSRERGVARFVRKWLSVRDDFRNWLIRAA
jgi:hypothetical protein